jgi:hypothetical protein
MRARFAVPLALLTIAALAACASTAAPAPRQLPLTTTRDAAGCPAAVSTVIRDAPASASDPATGPWLGQADNLRDLARTFRDPVDRQLAAELDYAGGQVAMFGTPPQIAIIPVQETCTIGDPASRSVSSAADAAARAWLQGNPPPARPRMTAGVITQVMTGAAVCPASAHGSQVTRGGGCETWSVTLTTVAGTLRAFCGDVADGRACTSATARPGPAQFFPDIGDVLYVPSDGQVTATADISIIYQIPWADWDS